MVRMAIQLDGKDVGVALMSIEEAQHFDSTGSFAAKVGLDSNQIAALGIDEDDYVLARSMDDYIGTMERK